MRAFPQKWRVEEVCLDAKEDETSSLFILSIICHCLFLPRPSVVIPLPD